MPAPPGLISSHALVGLSHNDCHIRPFLSTPLALKFHLCNPECGLPERGSELGCLAVKVPPVMGSSLGPRSQLGDLTQLGDSLWSDFSHEPFPADLKATHELSPQALCTGCTPAQECCVPGFTRLIPSFSPGLCSNVTLSVTTYSRVRPPCSGAPSSALISPEHLPPPHRLNVSVFAHC